MKLPSDNYVFAPREIGGHFLKKHFYLIDLSWTENVFLSAVVFVNFGLSATAGGQMACVRLHAVLAPLGTSLVLRCMVTFRN